MQLFKINHSLIWFGLFWKSFLGQHQQYQFCCHLLMVIQEQLRLRRTLVICLVSIPILGCNLERCRREQLRLYGATMSPAGASSGACIDLQPQATKVWSVAFTNSQIHWEVVNTSATGVSGCAYHLYETKGLWLWASFDLHLQVWKHEKTSKLSAHHHMKQKHTHTIHGEFIPLVPCLRSFLLQLHKSHCCWGLPFMLKAMQKYCIWYQQ